MTRYTKSTTSKSRNPLVMHNRMINGHKVLPAKKGKGAEYSRQKFNKYDE